MKALINANTNEHSISAEDANDAIALQRDDYSFSSGYWEGDRKGRPRHPWNDVESLSIQCYSSHPEVYAMAELIVESYFKTKKKVHDRDGYLRCARKLVASLWFHPSDWFRFSTKAEHFGQKRKQVWMSHKVLSLFRHMTAMKPPLVGIVGAAIPKAISRDGKGHSAIYIRKWFFTNTLKDLTPSDIGIDPDLPRVTLRNDEDIWIPIPKEEKEQHWYQFSEETLKAHSDMLYKADIRLSDGSAMPPYSTGTISGVSKALQRLQGACIRPLLPTRNLKDWVLLLRDNQRLPWTFHPYTLIFFLGCFTSRIMSNRGC